jgi:hypothetical protein
MVAYGNIIADTVSDESGSIHSGFLNLYLNEIQLISNDGGLFSKPDTDSTYGKLLENGPDNFVRQGFHQIVFPGCSCLLSNGQNSSVVDGLFQRVGRSGGFKVSPKKQICRTLLGSRPFFGSGADSRE